MKTYLEEQESDEGRRLSSDLLREVEGPQERGSVQEGGEGGQNGEHVKLGDSHELGGVEVVPVTEFVS